MESANHYSSIAAVPPGEWRSVAAPHGFYCGEGYLAALEKLRRRRRLDYLLLREEGIPVAAAVCFVVDAEQVPPFYDFWRLFFGDDGSPASRESLYPMLSCGPLGGGQNHLLVRAGLDADARRRAITRLAAEVRLLAIESGAASIVFPYLPTPELAELSDITDGLAAFSPPDYYLPLEGVSPEGYLSAMKRVEVLREMKCFARAGLRTEIRRLGECDLVGLARMYDATVSRYGSGGDVEGARRFLQVIQDALDSSTRVCLGLAGERPVGFTLNLRIEDWYENRCCGFDYESLQKNDFAYFNVVYYATIQAALIEGVSEIRFGPESGEAKLLRGCRVRATSFLLVPPDDQPREPARRYLLARSQRAIREVAANARRLGPQGAAADLDGTQAYYRSLDEENAA